MKRIVIYIVTLGLLALAPVKSTDIGSLRPIEVVMVSRQEDVLTISTDTEDVGYGTDAMSALENLKATTSGTIYLDTAEYLLIVEGAEDAAEQLKSKLKKSVGVCMADPATDLKAAAKYLPVHGDLPRLKNWKTGDKIPCLTIVGKQFLLTENN
jgi:hypothetical protein